MRYFFMHTDAERNMQRKLPASGARVGEVIFSCSIVHVDAEKLCHYMVYQRMQTNIRNIIKSKIFLKIVEIKVDKLLEHC